MPLKPPYMMLPGNRAHKACFSLTIYFLPSLRYLFDSFNLISCTYTAVAGNLVALRKLHSGDKNTLGCGRSNSSCSSEINPSKAEKKWKGEGDKGEEKYSRLCAAFPAISLPPFLLWMTALCSFHQQEDGLFNSEREIRPPDHPPLFSSLHFHFDWPVWDCTFTIFLFILSPCVEALFHFSLQSAEPPGKLSIPILSQLRAPRYTCFTCWFFLPSKNQKPKNT